MNTQMTNLQALFSRPGIKWILLTNLILFPIGLVIGGGDDFRAVGLIPASFVEQLGNLNFMGCFAELIRHQFFHAGISHIFMNMLFLLAVGLSLEASLGCLRLLLLYIASGMISALALVVFSPHLVLPLIGASGAIAGLMGATLVITREQPLGTLPVINFTVRSKHIIIAWLLWQIYVLSEAIGNPVAGQMVVHISGLAAGFAIAKMWKPQMTEAAITTHESGIN